MPIFANFLINQKRSALLERVIAQPLCLIMKYLLVLLLIQLSTTVFGQVSSQLNHDLGLSDSLIYSKEVRIYYTSGHTNYTGVFRMYQDKSDNWQAEFLEHFAKVRGQAEARNKKAQTEVEK